MVRPAFDELASTADRVGVAVKQVFLHIGAPKTGSTFVQDVLWLHREQLAGDGVCYPLEDSSEQLGATMDLFKRPFGGRHNPAWDGAWERVAQRIRDWPGDRVIYSSELMGLATPEQAQQAVDSVQLAEVHLIFTARDLARQLPSDWQEQVKHRHTVTIDKFIDDLVELGFDAPAPFGELFWGLHDGGYVLPRWRDVVAPERIHVITVAQPGAPPGLLWRRFATLLHLEPEEYDTSRVRHNPGMGLVETEFLRRFNIATRGTLKPETGPVINRVLGQDILAGREGAVPLRLPRRHRTWATSRSARMIDELAAGGYDVIGDLDELMPVFDEEPEQDPERYPPAVINKAAYYAIAGLIEYVLSLRGRSRRLAEELDAFVPGKSKMLAEMYFADSLLKSPDSESDGENDEGEWPQ